MPPIGFTSAQLEALEAAISQGVTTIHYENKTVTYRSLDEMLRLRNLMLSELGLIDRGYRVVASFSKGLT